MEWGVAWWVWAWRGGWGVAWRVGAWRGEWGVARWGGADAGGEQPPGTLGPQLRTGLTDSSTASFIAEEGVDVG